MPEYVYALHDFAPENEDEVPFRAGERIEVVEKDDLYGDGWWQGKNLAGRIGLFPQAYTTGTAPAPAPQVVIPKQDDEPSTTSSRILSAVPERDEHSPPAQFAAAPAILPSAVASDSSLPAQSATQPSAGLLYPENDDDDRAPSPKAGSEDGRRMMRATLTDVQKAIEQLGRDDRNDGRSFSFVSSRDGASTDRDTSETEMEESSANEEDGDDADSELGTGWHKDARQKLAEKARKAAMKEAKEREREQRERQRYLAPPIDVDISDESEPEEDETQQLKHLMQTSTSTAPPRLHDDIPEESEDERSPVVAAPVPAPEERTATAPTFPPIPKPPKTGATLYPALDDPRAQRASAIYPPLSSSPDTTYDGTPYEEEPFLPTPVSPQAQLPPEDPMDKVTPMPMAMPIPMPARTPASVVAQARDYGTSSLPSPAASSFSASQTQQSQSTQPTAISASTSFAGSALSDRGRTHPSEWTVDDVVDWLKSKGFDQNTCDKFIEQEITGDVLLDLTADLLKSELGILAFGKRVRIANAIADLRRPSSFTFPEAPARTHTPNGSGAPNAPSVGGLSPLSAVHTHLPPALMAGGAGYSRTGAASVRSDGSPPRTIGGDTGSFAPSWNALPAHTTGARGHARGGSDLSESVASSVRWGGTAESSDNGMQTPDRSQFGLGLGVPGQSAAGGRGRPPQLMLSPSEGALHSRAIAQELIPEEVEEHSAFSESEVSLVPTEKSKRRHLFGRSLEHKEVIDSPVSAVSRASSGNSKEAAKDKDKGKRDSTMTEASSVGSMRSKHTKKKSLDGTSTPHKSERLSIFSGIGGSLKGRKPAPRYSAAVGGADEGLSDGGKPSRLLSGIKSSSRKATPTRRPASDGDKHKPEPSSPTPAPDSARDKPVVNPGVLRKRSMSQAQVDPLPRTNTLGDGTLKQGQSILEQIGTPDHNGWMRKKGERYSHWRMRYFVLKGPHLYCLRSNSVTETKIKGYINITGYKVIPDENINPGQYGFRITHDHGKEHSFSSEEQLVIREWMKALMKTSISRDYQKPVVSSVNIPTIPLAVAQTMNPAPRPPSPGARDATQKALRRENPNQLSTRDARILMGIQPGEGDDSAPADESFQRRLPSSFRDAGTNGMAEPKTPTSPKAPKSPISPTKKSAIASAPPRPSRDSMRRVSSVQSTGSTFDPSLVDWANSHLPRSLQIVDDGVGPLCGGLTILRLAEAIKGKPASPPVLDSSFPTNPNDDKLEGLFRLFDYLLDNDVKVGSVSINDIRQGKREKIIQLVKALRSWEDKRRALAQSLSDPNMHAMASAMSMPSAMWYNG